MLKFQITLIAILIGCIAFVACDRVQKVLEPVMSDTEMMDTGDMTGMMDMVMDMMAHRSWASVALPVPPTEVTKPSESGAAHGTGTRTVYFNEAAAMANNAGTAYLAGSMIIKESMDPTNTFVAQVSTMTKTDDPMYADHGGWMYGVTGMPVASAEDLTMLNQLTVEMAGGCHSCHVKAGEGNDFVFVKLSMADGGMDGDGADGMDDDVADGMKDEDMTCTCPAVTDKMDDGGTDGMDDGGTDGNGGGTDGNGGGTDGNGGGTDGNGAA